MRLREFANVFGDGVVSVTRGNGFPEALQSIADKITFQFPADCFTSCPEDFDAETPGIQHDCLVERVTPAGTPSDVPECTKNSLGGYAQRGGDYVIPNRTDTHELTPSIFDDMSPGCGDRGSALQIEMVRRGADDWYSAEYFQTNCSLSEEPELVCPNL